MADKWRRKKEPHHIRLYHSIMDCPAWHHLTGNSVKLLMHLVRIDNGKRNGQIAYSSRRAADETGMSEKTCRRCFQELEEKGFIRCTQRGAFSQKVAHASLWRYTWAAWPEGKMGPTRDFEKWRPDGKTRGQFLPETAVNSTEAMETQPVTAANSTAEETGKSQKCDVSTSVNSTAHNSNHREARATAGGGNWKQPAPSSQPELADLRIALIDRLNCAEPGEQSRLALKIGCPGGTLSKFKAGGSLPSAYVEPLRLAVLA